MGVLESAAEERPNEDLKFENMGHGKSFLYPFPVSEFLLRTSQEVLCF